MHLDTLALVTIDGLTLQGDLAVPDHPRGAAVVCHPHPQYGGDRFNLVVESLFRAFVGAGLATVRFDFRGVNASEGGFGGGVDERLDAFAAVEAVEPFAGEGPLVLAGYSFGALVALDVSHPRVDGWVGVAPPLVGSRPAPVAANDARPVLLLVPAHDQFAPPATVVAATQGWTHTTVTTVDMTDHSLAGRGAFVGEQAAAFVSALAAR